MSRHFQVVVVGCGPAGTSTAATLLRAGVSVCVVTCDETRSHLPAEILSPSARREFDRLGFKQDVLDGGIPAYGIEAVWGDELPTFYPYMCSVGGNGFHVDRRAFHDSLLSSMCAAGNCDLSDGRFLIAERTLRGWTVSIQSRDTIDHVHCDLIVDATGRSAAVARSLGASRSRFDSLCGVSCVFDVQVTEQTLFVEATQHGWWYLAAMPGFRTVVCMVSDADIIQDLTASQSSRWLELLTKAKFIPARLGNLPGKVRTRTHPCESGMLDRIVGDAWVAVGDAAFIVDPLSSLGVLKALRSGGEAAEAIMGYFRGDQSALPAYAEACGNEFQTYLSARQVQYGMESRWSREPFWMRRHVLVQN